MKKVREEIVITVCRGSLIQIAVSRTNSGDACSLQHEGTELRVAVGSLKETYNELRI